MDTCTPIFPQTCVYEHSVLGSTIKEDRSSTLMRKPTSKTEPHSEHEIQIIVTVPTPSYTACLLSSKANDRDR